MVKNKSIRVLIAKPGLDGHESGAKVIARALVEAGMEVIYTGPRQTPQMIVNSALQEDADIVGLSILSGAHKTLCSRIMAMFAEKGVNDIPVILGGIIPESAIPELKSLGIREVFGPGTMTGQVIDYIRDLVAHRDIGL